MGRRGPTPTPTEVLKLRGSTLVTKHRERTEAKGPAGKPRCPEWLDADAKAMWRKLVPQLATMGVLTLVDGNALARYCRLWSRWRKAEAFIEQLQAAAGGSPPAAASPAPRSSAAQRALRSIPDVQLAEELQHRGWIVVEP